MKARHLFRCLSLATLGFAVAFSLVATAQEEQQEAQPEQAQQEDPQQQMRRLFVDDKLVLNVYAEAGQAGERVASIETGDAVDELERMDGSIRVRLDDGREGWVGANYLTTEPTAAVRLRELQREQKASAAAVDKKSVEEIARLRKQNAALEGEVKQLQATLAAAPAPAAEAETIEDEFGNAEHQTQPAPVNEPGNDSRALWIGLLAALIAGAGGFAAGHQTLARRIRKKFGGLKIY